MNISTAPKAQRRRRKSRGSNPVPAATPRGARPRVSATPHPRVEFRLDAPYAHHVSVAGTFNDWKSDANPLARSKDGLWRTEMRLPTGRYEYRYFVDGCWRNDPHASNCVENRFGVVNDLLLV